MRTLDAVRAVGAPVEEIRLALLAQEDVEQLIVDSLYCDRERVASPLVDEVMVVRFISSFIPATRTRGVRYSRVGLPWGRSGARRSRFTQLPLAK
ncbi:MAG TPA: hypothetical protein VKE51_09160 [Vicinamibacterales bacterium]|nr:hypothetical protein [Vicinamibacterales bacterium]